MTGSRQKWSLKGLNHTLQGTKNNIRDCATVDLRSGLQIVFVAQQVSLTQITGCLGLAETVGCLQQQKDVCPVTGELLPSCYRRHIFWTMSYRSHVFNSKRITSTSFKSIEILLSMKLFPHYTYLEMLFMKIAEDLIIQCCSVWCSCRLSFYRAEHTGGKGRGREL